MATIEERSLDIINQIESQLAEVSSIDQLIEVLDPVKNMIVELSGNINSMTDLDTMKMAKDKLMEFGAKMQSFQVALQEEYDMYKVKIQESRAAFDASNKYGAALGSSNDNGVSG
jgi:hypothetical protein